MDNNHIVQVVMTAGHFERYAEWLASHGLQPFRIPVDDDGIETYGVGVTDKRLKEMKEVAEDVGIDRRTCRGGG